MDAMVMSSPGPVESGPLQRRDLPLPEPRAGEVLLRVRYCGVCHTDLHIVEGEMPPAKLPVVPGHQVVAVVERVGPGVTHPAPGARVGVAWLYASCGVCEACRRGEENLCAQIVFTGYHVDGGYEEYLVARADYVYPLPGSFDDAHAAPLLCAGIVGYRALRLSGVRAGDRLGLFGFGASAHLAIQVARHWGCEVFVFTRGDAHRRLAEQMGAAWVGGLDDDAPHELDAAVVFAPAGPAVVEGFRRVRRGGTGGINAGHLRQIPAFDYNLLYWDRALRSVSNSTRQDGVEVRRLAASIPITVQVQQFSLAEANQVLASLKRGEITGAAVLDLVS